MQRNYKYNEFLDETNERSLESFAKLQNAGRYVPEKYLEKMRKRIFKNQKRCYKVDKKSFKRYNKQLDRQERKERIKAFFTKCKVKLKNAKNKFLAIIKKIFKKKVGKEK